MEYIVNSWWPIDINRLDLVRAAVQERADAAALLEAANFGNYSGIFGNCANGRYRPGAPCVLSAQPAICRLHRSPLWSNRIFPSDGSFAPGNGCWPLGGLLSLAANESLFWTGGRPARCRRLDFV